MRTRAILNSILLLIFSSTFVAGQDNSINVHWKWTRIVGGSLDDKATDLAVDGADNFYGIGSFTNSFKLQGQTVIMPGLNSYLVKLDSLGNRKWAQALPGSLLKISVDPNNSNNIVAAGVFSGNISIGSTNLSAAGSLDCFAVKTDSLGNIGWVTSWGGNGKDTIIDLEYQVDGNINAIGYFKSDVLSFRDNISVNKVYDSAQVNSRLALNLYSSKLLGTTGKAVWAAVNGQTGTALKADISADMRGNIGLSYGNGYSKPYSFFRYDSTFLNGELVGTINNYDVPAPGNTTEHHNVSFGGGNSRIDKYGNLFFDYAWEWQDTYGQCIGCLNMDEGLTAQNTNTDLPIPGTLNGCSQCSVSLPSLYPIGTYLGGTVTSVSHTWFVGSGFQVDFRGAKETSSLLNDATNKIYTTGTGGETGQLLGDYIFVGPTSSFQTGYGGTDAFVAAIDLSGVPLKADAGIDRTLCAGSDGVYLGGYPSAIGGIGLPYTFSWSPSTGLNNTSIAYPLAKPLVNTQYILTVTDRNGQVVKDTVEVFLGQSQANITPASTALYCTNDSIALTANTGRAYLWSTGATTRRIFVKTIGSYTVTVTDECGNVSVSAPVNVTTGAPPTQPSVSASGPLTFCNGQSVTLTAVPGFTYSWTRNNVEVVGTSQSLVVTTAGSYRVRIFNAVGCSATSSGITVTVNPNTTDPVAITAVGPTTFCTGQQGQLTAPARFTYLWSTGATTQNIYPSTSGSYSVTVSSAAGCGAPQTLAPVVITALPTPASPTISTSGPTVFCGPGQVTLTGPAGFPAYIWQNQLHDTISWSQSIIIDSTAFVRLQVINAVGCKSGFSDINVFENIPMTGPITITPTGSTTFCDYDSVVLRSPNGNGYTYLWNTGATTNSIKVKTAGSYSVTVSNGCNAVLSTPVTITVNPSPPSVITTSGPTTICNGTSVTLTAPAGTGYTYTWRRDGSSFATTQAVTVNTPGNYQATIRNSFNCVAKPTPEVDVVVILLPAVPIITASGPTTFCQGGSVTLTAPAFAGYTYLWSNGATTQSINVISSGSYTVTVTNSGGCSRTSVATTVTMNPAPSSLVTVSGPTTFCQGGSVTLIAPAGLTYLWSNGATTQSINVTVSGNYSVTVTNGTGCAATSTATTVTVYPLPAVPIITAAGPTSFCQGGSVTLTAPAGFTYLWSNGVTSQSVNINTSGSYSVTVSNANNCAAVSAVTIVTVNPLPAVPTITAAGPTSFCQGSSVTLTAPAGFTYLWSNGATTQSINVTTAGNFSVIVTNANNCSAASAVTTTTVNALPATPSITAGGPLSFCQGGSVTLAAPAGFTYLWSNGATTQSIIVSTSGTYSVTVRNANNCSATSAGTTVTVNPLPPTPVITASGPTSFCQGGSVTLTAPAGFSYLWSNGATTQSIIINTAGNYSVTVTNANNCSAGSATTTVTINPLPATPVITAAGPTTFCQGGSVSLSAPAGLTYLWSNGATTQTINVTTSGNYFVTVMNANNCSASSAATTVTVNARPPVPVITQTGNTLFSSSATGNQWYFNGTIIAGATAVSYTYTVGGDYSVTVTNAAGCSSSSAAFTAGRNGVVDLTASEHFYFNLFPNPVTSSQLTIEYQLEQPHMVGVTLFNMNGRRITIQRPVGRTAGRYTLNANTIAERLWKGVYVLEFTVDGKKVTRTIIKL